MSPREKFVLILFAVFLGNILSMPLSHAAKPVASVTGYKGEVYIVSGPDTTRITEIGQPLMSGDFIQTKGGNVQITFSDGALMKITPWANLRITEREEKSGWFVFKTKKAARRLTCFVGKFWFKSGGSGRKNYLQTPTAVCGLRGSISEVGYDPTKDPKFATMLNVLEGAADVRGEVLRGAFEGMTLEQAQASPVYQKLDEALQVKSKADASGKASDSAEVSVKIFEAVKAGADQILEKNPDPGLEAEAAIVSGAYDALIAKAKTDKALAEADEKEKAAVSEASEKRSAADTATGDEKTRLEKEAAKADEKAAEAKEAKEAVQKAKTEVDNAASAVTTELNKIDEQGIDAVDTDKIQNATEKAQNNATVVTATIDTTLAAIDADEAADQAEADGDATKATALRDTAQAAKNTADNLQETVKDKTADDPAVNVNDIKAMAESAVSDVNTATQPETTVPATQTTEPETFTTDETFTETDTGTEGAVVDETETQNRDTLDDMGAASPI